MFIHPIVLIATGLALTVGCYFTPSIRAWHRKNFTASNSLLAGVSLTLGLESLVTAGKVTTTEMSTSTQLIVATITLVSALILWLGRNRK